MSIFALVFNGRVAQIASAQFPVVSAMTWVDVTAVSPAPQPGWTYNGSAFAAPATPAIDSRAAAEIALDKSDVTIIRCVEHTVAIPAEWTAYRAALRAIVASGPTSAALPAVPAFPTGT